MPIDIEGFETDPDESLDEGGPLGVAHVLSFLRSNPDRAFTSAEIQDAIGSGPSFRSAEIMGISGVLSGLESRALVRRRMGYWALSEEGSAPTTGSERTGRACVVYEGPDGLQERTSADVRRESDWVVLAVEEGGEVERRHLPRERVYSIDYADAE